MQAIVVAGSALKQAVFCIQLLNIDPKGLRKSDTFLTIDISFFSSLPSPALIQRLVQFLEDKDS